MTSEFVQCPYCRTRIPSSGVAECPACGTRLATDSAIDSRSVDQVFGEQDPVPDDASRISLRGERHRHAAQDVASRDRLRTFQYALFTSTPRVFVTPTIVAANGVVFLLMVLNGVHILQPDTASMLQWGANNGPRTLDDQWWRVVTCMFLHFGIIHIGFNMWVLWDLGRIVERLVGNVGFLLLYFVSGIAASIASLFWNPHAVSAGASGAVFGVAGALLGFILLRKDTVPPEIFHPLRKSMTLFLVYNLIFGLAVQWIDMAAHVGGLVVGFLCGMIMSQPLEGPIRTRRVLRNGAVLLAGAIALPAAFHALPEAPSDPDVEVRRHQRVESNVLTTYAEINRDWRNQTIDLEQYVTAIERDVLPPWIESRRKLERLLDVPHINRQLLSRWLEIDKLREESWRLEIESLREQDADKKASADAKWERANRLMGELRRQT